MFKVNNYKIVFKRKWQVCYPNPDEPSIGIRIMNGRYDTVCEIYTRDKGVVTSDPSNIVWNNFYFISGTARLHPNDCPDKIVGKKIALRNAIGVWDAENEEWIYNCAEFYNKPVRTAIWKAFHAWVDQWNNQPSDRVGEAMEAIDKIRRDGTFLRGDHHAEQTS